jgi:hypothetical protein
MLFSSNFFQSNINVNSRKVEKMSVNIFKERERERERERAYLLGKQYGQLKFEFFTN